MSGRSKAGIIILLLLCVIIIGFGAYYIINLQGQIDDLNNQINELSGDSTSNNNTGIIKTWYSQSLDTINVNTTYEPLDPLNTTIEVNSGEWVYISFASNARIDPSDTLRHALHFYFAIDGVSKAPGFVYEEILEDSNQDDVQWIPVCFHAVYKDLVPGTYVISILVAMTYNPCPAQIGGTTSYMGSSLLIQTLIP